MVRKRRRVVLHLVGRVQLVADTDFVGEQIAQSFQHSWFMDFESYHRFAVGHSRLGGVHQSVAVK